MASNVSYQPTSVQISSLSFKHSGIGLDFFKKTSASVSDPHVTVWTTSLLVFYHYSRFFL